MHPVYCAPLAAILLLSTTARAEEAHDDIVITGKALPLTTNIEGQTDTAIAYSAFRNTPATTIADIVKLSPGVTFIQGNGPRDIGVSIRGSNARNGFGARNIQVFEDDFPVTQPDGLARFDLTDPHAYGAVDVVRGPSSARYGNYAMEGAINFRTRPGGEIDGIDVGFDGGGDGYRNIYATFGGANAHREYALFTSYARGDGATGHTGYETGTVNLLVTQELDSATRVTAKFIFNKSILNLAIRSSYDQFLQNPYQVGCEGIATAAPGCGRITINLNGRNSAGGTIQQTADEGGLARVDQRAIMGLRFEHDFGTNVTWRTQGTVDSRVVFQPTSASPFKGRLDSYNLSTDLTVHGRIAGMDSTSFFGGFLDYLDNNSFTYLKAPGGRNALGAISQQVLGFVRNMGLRAREELALDPRIRIVAGIGVEDSVIDARQTNFVYPNGGGTIPAFIPTRRHFWNIAPEASVLWAMNDALKLHARAGTSYGIPQAGNLFVTAAGVAGNNTSLKAQKNLGIDVGAELNISHTLQAELTGYYEWFRNELVTQSAGVNLLSYTSNVPRSVHRGIEVGLNWKPVSGVSLAANYSFNDQYYTDFQETLAAGSRQAVISRDGKAIPGVIPHFANVRLGYDQPRGPLEGLGGFMEVTRRSRYAIDNANILTLPGCTLLNLNIHYDPPPGHGWLSRLGFFASVQNLTDRTYIGSATIVSNSISPVTGLQNGLSTLRAVTGSIYAGAPRTVYAGMKAHF